MTLRWGIWWNFFLFFVFKSSFCYTYWAVENLCPCGSSGEWWRARLLRRKLRCGEVGWGVDSDVGRACLGSRGLHAPSNEGDVGSILGSGRFPGVGNGNPFQYPCLGNSMNRGTLQATVHGVVKSQTRLSDWAQARSHITKLFQEKSVFTMYNIVREKTVEFSIFLSILALHWIITIKCMSFLLNSRILSSG